MDTSQRTPVNKRALENGGDMDAFNNTVKRHQSASDGQPGRCILVDYCGASVQDDDIEKLLKPFSGGCPLKIDCCPDEGCALVEFPDTPTATVAVDYFSRHQTALKGVTVTLSFSQPSNLHAEAKAKKVRILLASVTNLVYPMDIDLVHHLFRKYGFIEKIVSFTRSPSMYQALIQFHLPEQAHAAMNALNNRNIYENCNALQVHPSKLTELTVKSNCVRSWDYTIGDKQNSSALGTIQGTGHVEAVLPTPGNTLVAPYGMQVDKRREGEVWPVATASTQVYTMGHISSHVSRPHTRMGSLPSATYQQIRSMERLPKELKDIQFDSYNPTGTPVIICYHLCESITLYQIFNLFSLYGVVERIKLLREKPDTALIQYSDPIYAIVAMIYLQHIELMGQEIQIGFSKNHEVKIPLRNEDMSRSKVFQSREQRYEYDGLAKYLKGVCKPTSTLFVANIALEVTEMELQELFFTKGDVKGIQFKPPKESPKTHLATLEMGSVSEACTALMCFHGRVMHGRSLKVAFSKSIVR